MHSRAIPILLLDPTETVKASASPTRVGVDARPPLHFRPWTSFQPREAEILQRTSSVRFRMTGFGFGARGQNQHLLKTARETVTHGAKKKQTLFRLAFATGNAGSCPDEIRVLPTAHA
jgi:hypothetical protein